MLKHTRATILSFLVAASVLLNGTLAATAGSGLPAAAKAGFADKLYRLDCGHSLANDESAGPRAKMLDAVSHSRRLAG